MADGYRGGSRSAEKFAEMVIEQLEAGTAPWLHPVKPGIVGEAPMNPKTEVAYRGVNSLMLTMMQPSGDPRWLTLRQANEMEARVKKGSRGVPIRALVGWETEEGKRLDKKEAPPPGARPLFRAYSVFHATQIDGLEPYQAPEAGELEWSPVEKAEEMLEKSGATIAHDQANQCYYAPREDKIHLPPKENFRGPEEYYSTALHELGHWTGHESRLNREMGLGQGKGFGSQEYAREELRAELASYMLAMELGIGHDPGTHAAYVQSWVKDLKETPTEILRASEDATKIVDFVMGRELGLSKEKTGRGQEAAGALEFELEAGSGKELVKGGGELLGTIGLESGAWTFNRTTIGAERGMPDQASHDDGLVALRGSLQDQYGLAEKYRGGEPLAPMLRERVGQRSEMAVPVRESRYGAEVGVSFEAKAISGEWNVFVPGGERVGEIRPMALGSLRAEFVAVQPASEALGGLEYDASESEEGLREKLETRYDRAMLARGAAERTVSFEPEPDGAGRAVVKVGALRVGVMGPGEKGWRFEAEPAGRELGLPGEEKARTELALKGRLRTAYTAQVVYGKRTDLNVPYAEREEALARGARWDPQGKTWYTIQARDTEQKFGRWLKADERKGPERGDAAGGQGTKAVDAAPKQGEGRRVDLQVSYMARHEAKRLGAKWDVERKTWYAMIGKGESLGELAKWDREAPAPGRPSAPEEFKAFCESAGLVIDGDPIMDGKRHRVPVEGGKPGATDGMYIGHLDGRPAGFVQNWRTADSSTWSYTGEGHALGRHAEAAKESRERAAAAKAERDEAQAKKAVEIEAMVTGLPLAGADHKYLETHAASGVEGENPYGARVDEENNLVVPLRDAAGKVWSVQRIGENGFKQFEKGGRVAGLYHVVGREAEIKRGDAVIVTTGFGTAAAVNAATDLPVVCAMMDTNLPKVARELSKRYGGKPVLILGDDDRHTVVNGKPRNSGRINAEAALDAVSAGRIAYPKWTSEEAAQKGMSDFADLAVARGRGALARQVSGELYAVKVLVAERDEQVRKPRTRERQREGVGR